MWRFAAGLVLLWGLGACNQIFGIPEVTQSNRVGGRVHGLWDGGDGVALRLQAGSVDVSFTASTNGDFAFDALLLPGAAYTVTLMTSPAQHTCVVEGGSGTVPDGDVESVEVSCLGPAVNVALWGRTGWSFDPTEELQTFPGSVVTQSVSLTVGSSAALTSATLDGAPVQIDEPTPRIALPLGPRTAELSLRAGTLSKTYQLVFDRGPAVLEQLAYGKASNTDPADSFGSAISLSGDTLVVGADREASSGRGVAGDEQAENDATAAGAVYVFVRSGTSWVQQAYLKASNTDPGDLFGSAVSLDGNTLAVGAYAEASSATGVNGNQSSNTAARAGAVYIFTRTGTTWAQQAYLKASNTEAQDTFGISLSLSGDSLAVGAYNEASDGTGNNNNAPSSGAVYVFTRAGVLWTQQAYLKASNTGTGDNFGSSVSLSGDSLAVGASGEASAATGIGGDQNDNAAPDAGAAYVFTRAGAAWTQQAYLKASNTGPGDGFGGVLSLSGDTLAVAAYQEASAATGIGGNQNDNTATLAGAVYVFTRAGTAWAQQAYLKASNTDATDAFGIELSLSGDLLAVGALREASAATGLGGNQSDNTAEEAGAAYLFLRTGTTWAQHAYLKASNTASRDHFGNALSLSGSTLAISARDEDSSVTGINNNQANNAADGAGAIYLFQ